jgi:hypothetical protein
MERLRVTELEKQGGDVIAWSDSDTGPTMAARVVGVGELGGAGLTGRYRIVVRLKDESVRSYPIDGDEEVLVFERATPPAPPKAAKPRASEPAA